MGIKDHEAKLRTRTECTTQINQLKSKLLADGLPAKKVARHVSVRKLAAQLRQLNRQIVAIKTLEARIIEREEEKEQKALAARDPAAAEAAEAAKKAAAAPKVEKAAPKKAKKQAKTEEEE